MTIKDDLLLPYFLEFDGVQYTLMENRESKSGKDYFETHGYYVDLVYAIKKICQLEIAKKESLSLKEFIEEWKTLMNKFKPLLYEN